MNHWPSRWPCLLNWQYFLRGVRIWTCWFLRREENCRDTQRKRTDKRNNKKTQHTKCVERGTRTHATMVGVGALTSYRGKVFSHIAMLPIFWGDLNKPRSCKYGRQKRKKKMTCITSLCMIALRHKTIAHTFLPSFDNANSRLFQEMLLTSSHLLAC